MKKIFLIILILLLFSFSAQAAILVLNPAPTDTNFVNIGISGNAFGGTYYGIWAGDPTGFAFDTNFETANFVNVTGDSNFSALQATYFFGDGSGLTGLVLTSDVNGADIRPQSVSIDNNLSVRGDANFINIGVTEGIYSNRFFGTGDSNFVNLAISGQLYSEIFQTALNEPTGFPSNCSDVIISFKDSTRTFSIQPSGASFDVYHSGIKFTKTGEETLVTTDDEGAHYIYYDGTGALVENVTPSSSELQDIIKDEAEVAVLYWDTTGDQNIYFTGTNECHGTIMDGATHAHHHFTHGTHFESGLAIGDITADGTGDDAPHAQLSVSNGEIRDEDSIETIADDSPQNLSAPANLPVFYRSGTNNWRKIIATDYPITTTGTGRAAWNEFTGGAWQLTEITNNQFVLSHLFATNNFYEPIAVIVGQSDYSNLVSAREGAASEINNLITSGLGFQEFVPIATIIFQTSNSYSNAVKSRIRTTDTGDDYIDWRFSELSPTSTPGNHSNLAGLADNDHVQYVLDTGDRMIGDLNGEFDLNFLNALIRNDLNVIGDINFGGSLSVEGISFCNGGIIAASDSNFVNIGISGQIFGLPSAFAAIQTDFNTFYNLLLDSNNASRLDYLVIANPPTILPDTTCDTNTAGCSTYFNKTDINAAFVPYVGADADLNMGMQDINTYGTFGIGAGFIDWNGTHLNFGVS